MKGRVLFSSERKESKLRRTFWLLKDYLAYLLEFGGEVLHVLIGIS
jgi:hypothetical protein